MDNFWRLSSDIFSDVLSRLPTKCLIGLKCVSKRWHQLISDRVFMKVQSRKREPVFGFFFQERFGWRLDDLEPITHIPVAEGAGLQQTIFSFLPEHVVVMASCNGLVCCCSCVPFHDRSIYVCNPLNREWIRLNLTNPDRETSIALAFDPCCSTIESSLNFKLVKVQQYKVGTKHPYFSFDIYSSDTGAWRTSKEICLCKYRLHKNKGIFIGGVLHWLTENYEILTFNIENELSGLISVEVAAASQLDSIPVACIGESNGQLCYITASLNGLRVWVLDDYFEFKWTLQLSKTLDQMEEEHPSFCRSLRHTVQRCLSVGSSWWVEPLAFKDGYLLMRVSPKIYLYHVETNKMKEVCIVSELGSYSTYNPTVLPYSLSLVPLNWD